VERVFSGVRENAPPAYVSRSVEAACFSSAEGPLITYNTRLIRNQSH
jgi:hypothetical protein